MSTFVKMSFDGKCDVCGKETKVVACVSSSMGAISYKYCEECLQKELLGKTGEEFIEGHYWNSNPDKFLEDLYGIKLLRYQKIILKQMLKIVK